MIKYYIAKGSFWIRIFGIGFSCENRKYYDALFSEKMGHRKGFKIGKYVFHYLEKE